MTIANPLPPEMTAGTKAVKPGIILGAALLLLLLNMIVIPTFSRDIWVDESFTLRAIGAPPLWQPRSFQDVVTWQAEKDPSHPPAFFVALAGWGRLAGWNLAILRCFSLFAGMAGLALLFRLARRHFSPSVALLALIFAGFNVVTVHMLRDLRSYAMLQLVVTAMLYAWAQLMSSSRTSVAVLLLFVASAALMPWTHYYGVFAVLALAFCHLVFARSHRLFLPLAAGFVVAGLLFLPWAGVVTDGLLYEQGNTLSRGHVHLHPLELTRQILEHFSNGNEALLLLLLALALPAVSARLPGLWVISGLGLVVAFDRLVPVLAVRYLFFLWPGLAVLAAAGGDRLRRARLPAIILPAIWLLALIWQTSPHTQGPFRELIFHGLRPPYNSVARQLQGRTLADDVLVWHRDESHVDYLNHELLYMLRHATSQLPLERRRLIVAPLEAPAGIHEQSRDDAFKGARRVWLAWEKDRRHWRLGPMTNEWLPQQRFRRCNVLDDPLERARIELWAQQPTPGSGALWRFADDAGRVVSLQPGPPSPAPSGAGRHYTLFWDSELSHGYSAGLYRLDANGGLQAQLDVGLGRESGCHAGTLAGPVAPGDSLWLGVYDWRSGARLTPLDAESEHNLVRIG